MQTDSGALVNPVLNWRTISITLNGSTPVQFTNSPLTVSSLTGNVTTGLVTVVTSAAHQLIVGQFATIAGATDGRYDGQYPVISVTNSTTFTYQLPYSVTNNTNFSTLITPDTNSGPATVSYRIVAQRMWIIAPAHAVTVGPNSLGTTFPIALSTTQYFENPPISKFYLDNWYAVGTSADVLKILYV